MNLQSAFSRAVTVKYWLVILRLDYITAKFAAVQHFYIVPTRFDAKMDTQSSSKTSAKKSMLARYPGLCQLPQKSS